MVENPRNVCILAVTLRELLSKAKSNLGWSILACMNARNDKDWGLFGDTLRTCDLDKTNGVACLTGTRILDSMRVANIHYCHKVGKVICQGYHGVVCTLHGTEAVVTIDSLIGRLSGGRRRWGRWRFRRRCWRRHTQTRFLHKTRPVSIIFLQFATASKGSCPDRAGGCCRACQARSQGKQSQRRNLHVFDNMKEL
jgi:hypothetical protein